MADKLQVGIFGNNGHQIQGVLAGHPAAELAVESESLDELLANPQIELISLCSPRRADQSRDAIRCLEAGKHVYAEKPSALSERDLDAIIAAAKRTKRQYHEMAGTICQQPYATMRELVRQGTIGDVVQVLAQKSYPWGDWRPADENIDGGLALQVGVYPMRFVEHIAQVKIASIESADSRVGNLNPQSDCRRAVSFLMTLANGGVASAVCNYLNPMGEVCWGYEILRIFGTRGILESSLEGPQLRLMLEGKSPEPIAIGPAEPDYFTLYAQALRGGAPMPFTIEDELSPTRWAIRAREMARQKC